MIPDPFDSFITEEQAKQISDPTPFASFADFEVEYELIGSILRKGTIYEDVISAINSDMFHNSVCRDLFNSMGKVREHGLVLDVITIADQLERDGLLSTIQYSPFTGRTAIGAIRERGNPKNFSSYVDLIVDYWAKRQLDYIAQTMTQQARNGRRAVDILSDTRVKFDEIDVLGGNLSTNTYNSSSLASMAYDHATDAANGKIRGVQTGYLDLDKIIKMLAGDLLLVAGRPGQGKSALVDSIGLNAAKAEKKVAIFSLEMSGKQVATRLLSQISGVPTHRILEGKMTELEWPLYTQAVEIFEKLPIMINDKAGITIPQMRTEIKRMSRDLGGVDICIVDYIQLMKSIKKVQRRDQEIGELSRGLKELGRDFDIPILAAAQMSRAVEIRSEKRPVLSDLRESGDLENDADVVMFIYRPDQYEKDSTKQNIAEIIVAKQRNGPVGSAELIFRGALAKFENAMTRNFNPNSEQNWQNRQDIGDD